MKDTTYWENDSWIDEQKKNQETSNANKTNERREANKKCGQRVHRCRYACPIAFAHYPIILVVPSATIVYVRWTCAWWLIFVHVFKRARFEQTEIALVFGFFCVAKPWLKKDYNIYDCKANSKNAPLSKESIKNSFFMKM